MKTRALAHSSHHPLIFSRAAPEPVGLEQPRHPHHRLLEPLALIFAQRRQSIDREEAHVERLLIRDLQRPTGHAAGERDGDVLDDVAVGIRDPALP